jgi:hypothetical protein
VPLTQPRLTHEVRCIRSDELLEVTAE